MKWLPGLMILHVRKPKRWPVLLWLPLFLLWPLLLLAPLLAPVALVLWRPPEGTRRVTWPEARRVGAELWTMLCSLRGLQVQVREKDTADVNITIC